MTDDLFGWRPPMSHPDVPGHRGVDTSIAAAEDLAFKLGGLQRLAHRAIAAHGPSGLTVDELGEVVDSPRWSIQPRTSELKRKGLIVDSGLRRRNCTGKAAIVWVTPEHKRDAA